MTTLQDIRDALDAKTKERAELSRQATVLSAEITRLRSDLEAKQPIELVVTDHALLRYAERVMEFDSAQVVAMIRDRVAPAAYLLGDGEFPICPGFAAVVKNRAVVTVVPK